MDRGLPTIDLEHDDLTHTSIDDRTFGKAICRSTQLMIERVGDHIDQSYWSERGFGCSIVE